MGPYLIFDKSFLESLTANEAVWLDMLFMNNVTPLFYIESLADLGKENKKGKIHRTPEDLVGELASKSPFVQAVPAVYHVRLVLGNLLGQEVGWKHHRPIIGGGEYKKLPDGKITIDFKQFPEFAALERWKAKDFKTVEEQLTQDWRETLSNLSFDQLIEKTKSLVSEEKLSSEKDVIKFVNRFMSSRHNQFIHLALDLLDISEKARTPILKRWYNTRPQPFNEFAPYAAHVLKVDLFFYICLGKSFISKDRPSNKIDLAYLYYLPFCMVFASRDKLHKRIAPLFVEDDQIFIWGDDLKSDLKKINDYFAALPEEIKIRGAYQFGMYPPYDAETLVGKLHDKFMSSSWREKAKNNLKEILKPIKKDTKLVKFLKEQQDSKTPYTGPPVSSDEADSMILTRRVPAKRGDWVLFSPEVIEAARNK